MRKYLFLLFLMLTTTVSAQNSITLTGQVIDDLKEPLIGVSVSVKGTTNGTSTDLDGNFILNNVPSNSTIVVSMIGFDKQEIALKGQTELNVILKEKATTLDDVVVIGYGVVKKSDLTSSITTVKGEKLQNMSAGNALNALQGQANGVQITSAGGPGDVPRIIIRGVTTQNGTDPLYVVDGVPLPEGSNINYINQHDIESMEILKDASASAIYGTRGSNGVVLITTKKGKVGKPSFQFSSSVGFQTMTKPDIAGAEVYEKVFKARYENDGSSWQNAWGTKTGNGLKNSDGTDWWDKTVNDFALQHNYNFGFQGGSEQIVYSGSIGYFRQESQFDAGYWQRVTGRFNTEYKLSSIVKFGMDFNPSYENWEDTPNLFGAAMKMDPTTPVYRPESDWSTTNPYNNFERAYHNQEHNPLATMSRQNAYTNKYALSMNPYVNIEPIKGLIFRSQFGMNVSSEIFNRFYPVFFIHDLEKNDKASAIRKSTTRVNWAWTNTVNYMKTFDEKHNLNLMGGYTMEKDAIYWNLTGKTDVPSNHPDLQYPSGGTTPLDKIDDYETGGTDEFYTLISYIGRVMYNFDSRYFLTATMRADGSSRFPANKKYAFFPSVSGAWNVSNEPFMQEQEVFDNLKVRVGWGRVGNQFIAKGAYLNLVDDVNYVLGGDRVTGTAISQVGNSTLKWETVEDYNFGVDMSFLNNRLEVTADIFRKKSKDMLIENPNLLVLGYPMWDGRLWGNIGSMQAQGWELSFNWRDAIQDFRYEVGLNLSSVQNKAIKFSDGMIIWNKNFSGSSIIRNIADEEISQFYGYVADGIFQNEAEVNAHSDKDGKLMQQYAEPGDIRFKDINGDGKLDDNDKKYIGNAYPDLMLGLNLKAYYKNFDLTANLYGTIGNDIYNSAKAGFYSGEGGQNVYADAFSKAWNGEGSTNTYPRLSYSDKNNNYKTVSSFFVEDGSYFRCKLLQLGYTLPKNITKHVGVRFSVSAQNLFTITNYSGMDPERAAMGAALEAGVDEIGYPNPRTFLFGVNVNF